MKKLTIGVMIGMAVMFVGKAYADSNKYWDLGISGAFSSVERIQDGNTFCYIYSSSGPRGGISCVRIK